MNCFGSRVMNTAKRFSTSNLVRHLNMALLSHSLFFWPSTSAGQWASAPEGREAHDRGRRDGCQRRDDSRPAPAAAALEVTPHPARQAWYPRSQVAAGTPSARQAPRSLAHPRVHALSTALTETERETVRPEPRSVACAVQLWVVPPAPAVAALLAVFAPRASHRKAEPGPPPAGTAVMV